MIYYFFLISITSYLVHLLFSCVDSEVAYLEALNLWDILFLDPIIGSGDDCFAVSLALLQSVSPIIAFVFRSSGFHQVC
jgi:hypothetical protein